MQEIHLVSDLAIILIAAGIITLIFKRLKQPMVLGYIVAGFLVGPYFDVLPTIIEKESVHQWSEIGVIFLLFALGLEFSFKKLVNVGSSALITAGTEIVTMFSVGTLIGYFLNWTLIESFMLGGMLSMSSTTIIIKAFDDLGIRKHKFTSIVFGTLVVEDIVAIIMMVLLSTAALSKEFAGVEMLYSVIKLAFFLVLWFLIGIYVFPSFFQKAKRWMNDENLLVISIGFCFGMVAIATYTGFSAALGAFIMGSIFAETVQGEHIEKVTKGIKDLFGAIFFVSVGMMVDPSVLVEYWFPVLLLTLATIFGKAFFSFLGVLLSGQDLRTAIQSGMSLAQIGEFAFIIATLGYTLGVMSPHIYPIIVAVSVISTFTTPYMIRLANPLYDWVYPRLSNATKESLAKYVAHSNKVTSISDWKNLLSSFVVQVIGYTVICVGIILFMFQFVHLFLLEKLSVWLPIVVINIVQASLTIALLYPFLKGLMVNRNNKKDVFLKLWKENKVTRGGLMSLLLLRVFIAVVLVTFVLYSCFTNSYLLVILVALGVVLFILFSRFSFLHYSKIEKHFIDNLNTKEELDKQQKPLRTSFYSHFAHQNIHLAIVDVSVDAPFIGKKISETQIKIDFGVSIIKIIRGSNYIYLPSGEECIYPYDQLLVLGSDEQIERFNKVVEQKDTPDTPQANIDVTLTSFIVEEHSSLVGKSIMQTGIRKSGCMIIGIDRQTTSIMNPDSNEIIQLGDIIWIVGDKQKIQHSIC
jgi:monovalent cation:H+ antiporter-2, CPA2 family